MLNPDRRINLSSCPNCVVWIANADDSGIHDAAERALFHSSFTLHTANISDLFVGDGNDHWFSHHYCDTCGAVPGDRHAVIGYLCD